MQSPKAQDLNLYPLKVHIAVTVPIVDHQEHP